MNGAETEKPRVARDALLSAVAQSAVMVAGGVNAILIGARYAVSAETDGLFTSFAIYSLVVVIAASSRTALVPRLIDKELSFKPFNEVLAVIAWATPLIGLLFALVGIPIVSRIAGEGSHDVVRYALLVFWPAATTQLLAAVAAAMLGVRGDFGAPAIGFVVGGAISVLGFVALEPELGLKALPVAVLAGSSATALIELFALRKFGWHFRSLRVVSPTKFGYWIWTMVLGGGFYICSQAFYVVTLTVASNSLGTGTATVYSYAYFGIGLITAITAGSGSFALAAPIAASWEGDARMIEPVEDDVARFTLVILAAVGGIVATAGTAIITPVLRAFDAEQVSLLVKVLLALLATSAGTALTIVPLAALFAANRYGRVLVIGIGGVVLQVLLSLLAISIDESLILLAAAASVTVVLLAWTISAACHRSRAIARIGRQLIEVGAVAVPATASYAIAWLIFLRSGSSGTGAELVAALTGTLLFASMVVIALPKHRALLLRMASSFRPTATLKIDGA